MKRVQIKNKEDLRITEVLKEECADNFFRSREELRRDDKEKSLKIYEEKRNFDRRCKESRKYLESDSIAIQRKQFGSGFKL